MPKGRCVCVCVCVPAFVRFWGEGGELLVIIFYILFCYIKNRKKKKKERHSYLISFGLDFRQNC